MGEQYTSFWMPFESLLSEAPLPASTSSRENEPPSHVSPNRDPLTLRKRLYGLNLLIKI